MGVQYNNMNFAYRIIISRGTSWTDYVIVTSQTIPQIKKKIDIKHPGAQITIQKIGAVQKI